MLEAKKFDPKKLAAYGSVRKYVGGDIIVREGDGGDEMFIILQGKVTIEVGDITVGEMGSGDFFGEMSLIDNAPRSATVTAAELTLLFAINDKNFERIISWEPVIAIRIMKSLSKRVRELNQEIKNIFEGQE
jgi:CRP-like cAMP-binding protein